MFASRIQQHLDRYGVSLRDLVWQTDNGAEFKAGSLEIAQGLLRRRDFSGEFFSRCNGPPRTIYQTLLWLYPWLFGGFELAGAQEGRVFGEGVAPEVMIEPV